MKFIKTRNSLMAALVLLVGTVFALNASTLGQSAEVTPIFNAFHDVQGQGDEADFVRVRKSGSTNAFGNSVNDACTDGQEVSIQVYIHNSASQDYNGTNFDGTAVAKDTRLSITKSGSSITGVISASNAPSVSDSATVMCNGKPVAFDFKNDSAIISNDVQSNVVLKNEIFSSNGTPIGYQGQNGIFPACWKYVSIVYAKVVIRVPEEPVVVKQCLLADPKRITRTKYDLTASATVENTTVSSYTFTVKNASGAVVDTKVFNTNALSQTYNFEQNTPGTYTVKAVVMTADGQAEGDCQKTVTVEEEPKTPAYSCDFFALSFVDRKANVSFKPVAVNGATFKDAVIKYNADGNTKYSITTNTLNSEGKIVSSYTFASTDKNVEAVATVRFNVPEGNSTTVKEVTCREAKVLGTTTPMCTVKGKENMPANSKDCKVTPAKKLPDTGAGNIAGLMAIITVAGAFAHRQLTLKRNR